MSVSTPLQVRWPATPVDGQSLMGLIVETARENGHGDIGTIMSFAKLGTFHGLGRFMRFPEPRSALAFTLRQPEDEIEARAHIPAEPLAGMETVDFFGATVPAFDILYDRRRVGDTSRSDFFHKAAWQFIHLPVDVDDGARIVDRCQSCGTKLGWRTIDDAAHCAAYKSNYVDRTPSDLATGSYDCGDPGAGANDQPERIDPAALERLSLLARLIDPRQSVHGPAQAALPPDLRRLNRGVVFYLGLKLGRAIALEGRGARLRRAASAPFEEAVSALEVGSTIIAGWPESVVGLLKGKADLDHERAMAAIEAVRSVSHGESAWPEHREAIGKALPALVSGHYQHVIRRLLPDIVDGREAARIIGIRSHSMAKLIRTTTLVPVISRGSAKTHGSFRVSDVEEVAAAVKDSMEATALVEEIGITLHGVEQLICTGHLDLANHPAVRALYPNLRVTRRSYERLLEGLRRGVTTIEEKELGEPLRRAVLTIGAREKPWAAILDAMIEGRIRYSVARPAGRLVDRIDVVEDDALVRTLEKVFDRSDHPDFEFAPVMRQRDAIELLNIDPSRYQDIAKQFPPPVFGPKKTLVVTEILKVAKEVIDQREARKRWGASLDRRKMIEGGIGWRRAEVEEARLGRKLPQQPSFDI